MIIKPNELEGSAKDLAILEKEAEHLSRIKLASDRLQFDMSVNGSSYSASSSNEVINNLQKERDKITVSEGGKAQRDNIQITRNNNRKEDNKQAV